MTLAIVAAAASATLIVACGGTTAITELTGPDGVRCQTAVAAPQAALPAGGGRVTLSISAGRECTWTASTDASWAQVAPASGQGAANVTLTATANPDGRARSFTLVVNDSRLSLTQEPSPCTYELGNYHTRMSHEGGRVSISVSTLGGCEWRAHSNSDWARVLNDSGTGDGTVLIDVSRNAAGPRSASITIAGREFTVEQAAAGAAPSPAPNPSPSPSPNPPPPPIPPPPSDPLCVFFLEPDSRSFDADGGDGSFKVTTLPTCSWSPSSGADWISIRSASSVTGSATVQYRVSGNNSTGDRSGSIAVGGRSHSVRQAGARAPEPRKIKLEGNASNVGGSCPNRSFTVDGRSVFTTGDTRFKGGCNNLRDGVEVEVEGDELADGRVRAREVEIDD